MAIGRISGPMLFADLERQGLDLSVDGNLIYFDVNRRRIGINTNSPEYTVHIASPVDTGETIATLFVEGNIIANNNITGNSITVANAFTLPTDSGQSGDVIISDGVRGTRWAKNSVGVERKKWNYFINDLPAGGIEEFDIDIGVSSIVYGLTVSRPCLVEVFANKEKNETNPYTFWATLDHLTDDGTVLLDDGSVIQQRQYSIFANQEDPAEQRVYARISNIDGISGNVDINLTYFAGVTDTRTGIYDMNVVDSLPIDGYTGQTVVIRNTSKMYVWYDNDWHSTT
jgi:hypothetical protein